MPSRFTSARPTLFSLASTRQIVAPGLNALRRYWKPFLGLQAVALAVVLSYFWSAPVRSVCEALSAMRQRSELLFSAVAAAFAGALLPEIAKALLLADRRIDQKRLRNVAFAFVAFSINGIIIDLQYRGLALAIGSDNHVWTVIKKTLADQFITTPLYGTPYWLFVYELRAQRYSLPRTLREVTPRWYLDRVLPLLVSGWAFWIPMVVLIYLLPGPLQFCLYCFALAAWSLLMVFIAGRPDEATLIVPGVEADAASP